MTVTPAKIAANRANSRKSTGPRTAAGKARVRLNGFSHGLFAAHLLHGDEEVALFETFRRSMLRRLAPDDMVEQLLCERIVAAAWKLRRCQRAERCLFEVEQTRQQHAAAHAPAYAPDLAGLSALRARSPLASDLLQEIPALERLSRYEQRLDYTIHRCLRELERLRGQSQKPNEDDFAESPAGPEDTEISESAETEISTSNMQSKAKGMDEK